MAGNARAKIDRQTMSMFDPEVDKPEHDAVLTTLFSANKQLVDLLTEYHQVKALEPFTAASMFSFKDEWESSKTTSQITSAEAAKLTGKEAKWATTSPIRLLNKASEVILHYSADVTGRYSRIVGFIDIVVLYELVSKPPMVKRTGKETYEWVGFKSQHTAYIEVKGQWPTSGNLLRQLNLYRASSGGTETFASRHDFVVGPDDSMNDLVCAHGYRLVTFDATGTNFQLVPGSNKAMVSKRDRGQF